MLCRDAQDMVAALYCLASAICLHLRDTHLNLDAELNGCPLNGGWEDTAGKGCSGMP